jgi:hypothetical protein
MTATLISMIDVMNYVCPPDHVVDAIMKEIDQAFSSSDMNLQWRIIETLVRVLDEGTAPEPSRLKAVELLLGIGMKDNDPGAFDALTLWIKTPVYETYAITERVTEAVKRIKARWADGTE